ncbi:mitotic spindle assembly checkpoint protein MAD2A-like [Apostichopus japonicus]|uniref:mitotic spindle assembly checkpoint protein MAD2A-like n=1 Tax=Stichopus japonicus TaxID=307972 RepID=UPI003AB5BA89
MAATSSASTITLKGSAEIVAEFFHYGINSILYQRGIYPPEHFTMTKKYGLSMLVTTDESLKAYFSSIVKQLEEWLTLKIVQKVVVVVSAADNSDEVLERWQFDVETEQSATVDSKPKEKSKSEIQKGIVSVIKQITATVTFLPLLEVPCTFNLLIYTDKDLETPAAWEESKPFMIGNSEEVKLRSFTTSIHKVEAMVSYRVQDD